jgi:hypothetical protein
VQRFRKATQEEIDETIESLAVDQEHQCLDMASRLHHDFEARELYCHPPPLHHVWEWQVMYFGSVWLR